MTQTQTTNKFGVKVGDIYSCTWGYDETHVNFYEVVRVTATKAEVQPIWAETVLEQGPMGNTVVAKVGTAKDWDVLIRVNREDVVKSKLCTVKSGWKGSPTIVLQSGRHWAHLWDGKAVRVTDTMYGR